MRFDNRIQDEPVYPGRKPWIGILIAVAVAGSLAYFLWPRDRGGSAIAGNQELSAAEAGAGTRPVGSNSAAMPGGTSAPAAVPTGAGDGGGGGVVNCSATAGTNAEPLVRSNPGAGAGLTLASARALEEAGKLEEARGAYLELQKTTGEDGARAAIEERLGAVNLALLLSQQSTLWKEKYVVRRSDAVEKIARKFGTTTDLILKINGLNTGSVIRVGRTLLVPTGKFSIDVCKNRYELVVRRDGEFFKRYQVGLGANNKTAAGSFVVTDREADPTWWPEGKDPIPAGDERNLLGTRWLAIKDSRNPRADRRGLGIHGTRDDSSIGKSMSAGCVRMLNAEVEELFMLIPVGTPVVISE